VTSCEFESRSEELSTSNDYQKCLNQESKVLELTSISLDLGYVKFGQDNSFSRSE